MVNARTYEKTIIKITITHWHLWYHLRTKIVQEPFYVLKDQLSFSTVNELMLTTQPANFKEVTLRKTPSALLSNPANYPRKTPFHLHVIQPCSTPQAKVHSGCILYPILLENPRKMPFHWHCYPVLATSQGQFHSTCILCPILCDTPWKIPFQLPCYLILLYFLRKIFHSTCLVI